LLPRVERGRVGTERKKAEMLTSEGRQARAC
jgi:hypothetical protein